MKTRLIRSVFAILPFVTPVAFGQDVPIANWSAPPFWQPASGSAGSSRDDRARGRKSPAAVAAVSAPLPFIAITPCRLMDTRDAGQTGPFGPPTFPADSARNVPVATHPVCTGIPATAGAYSLNITVTNTGASPFGFLKVWPQGSAEPNVSTLNWSAGGETVANAAIVPAGTDGGISIRVGNASSDVIVDINGYYAGSVVQTLNGLSGNVTLAAGSNVTITPSGQTLTLSSTGGGALPAGTDGQTLRYDGSNLVANSVLTNSGTEIGINAPIVFGSAPQLSWSGYGVLHSSGASNSFYVGIGAGNFTNTGGNNTGVGTLALNELTSGGANAAVGANALDSNTTGFFNTAVGAVALATATTASQNTAIGYDALKNATGGSNTALGSTAGLSLTSGASNILIGVNAGAQITTGSNNIDIGSFGFNNESNTIRIGDNANQSSAIIAGIAGMTAVGGVPVLITGGGRLGTTTSSLRFKRDVHDIGGESDALMTLRPVAFRYKEDPADLVNYGLIAEELAEVYPDLVANDSDGRPQAIRYHELNALLLNELQKQHHTVETQERKIRQQESAIEELRSRLADLERQIRSEKGD